MDFRKPLNKFQFVEQNMKKHLANITTGLRIIGSIALLFFDVPSFPFYITYKITGSLLFLLPFTLQFIEPTYGFVVVCSVATIAAIGEGYFAIKENKK